MAGGVAAGSIASITQNDPRWFIALTAFSAFVKALKDIREARKKG